MKTFLLKKSLFFVFLLISASLMAQTGYDIKLEVTGYPDGAKFRLADVDAGNIADSAYLKGGMLSFKGHVSDNSLFRIISDDNKYVNLYIENKVITIKGSSADFQYSKIEGSEINSYYVKSRDWQKDYKRKRDSIVHILFSPEGANSPRRKEMIAEYRAIDKIVLQYRINFIKTEKPTYFTLHELYFLRNDLTTDTLKLFLDRFPKNLLDTKAARVILSYINNKAPQVGKRFIDIEGMDVNGIKHKLSALAGKYVLLDFWASWCVPCRKENPATIKTYNLYHPKGFEVFSFSIDANKSNWVEAIKTDKLTWLNISDLSGDYSKGAANYQVRAIPQDFLIDPNGIIIAKDLWGDDLQKKLKEIYKD